MTEPSQEAADLALAARRVVTPEGERGGAVLVRGGRIAAVVGRDAVPRGTPVEDVDPAVLLPGLVDSHVHVNEPGRTEWEGWGSATRAAAAGGVTTLVDMPLNSSPVTTTRDALLRKTDAAAGQGLVDCGFWGGLVPGNAGALGPLLDAGARGVKAFLCHSGIERQPSQPLAFASPSGVITGFTSTRNGTSAFARSSSGATSITARRMPSWTWGAASPTPSYSYMVSRMSSISFWKSGSLKAAFGTGFAGERRTGWPIRATFRIDMGSSSRWDAGRRRASLAFPAFADHRAELTPRLSGPVTIPRSDT